MRANFQKTAEPHFRKIQVFLQKTTKYETLRQFWNALRGLAARCDFDNQTESLIMDAFIQNMHNKTVQERLSTEPKENTQEALRFAVAFEEGISQQKSFMGSNDITKEPIFAIDNKRKNPCTRCGMEFVQNHLTICKAKKEKCRNCGIIGHFMRMCKRPKTANFRGTGRSSNGGGLRRVNLIGQAADQSEGSSAWNEDNVVLRLDGTGVPPFVLKGRTNKQPFTTMIDSGSPITIFTRDDVRKILKSDVIFARPMPKNEEYVDYNGKPLNLIGFINVDVQVGKRTIKRARIVIARDGKKSVLGRDWLTQRNYRVAEASKEGECKNTVNKIENNVELAPELKRIKQKFPEIFSRQGKITGHTIKIEFKEGARVTEQKGRRVPLQLQTSVDGEIKCLLAAATSNE